MNFRCSKLAKTFLLLCLVLVVLHLVHPTAPPLSHEQMRAALVGKWNLIVDDPAWVENRTYEFFADGRIIEKSRSCETVGPGVTEWLSEVSFGHYKVTKGNRLTSTSEKLYVEGKLQLVQGRSSGIPLQMNEDKTIIQIDMEHFQRVKS
jgi:hypothetical protein